MQQLSHFLLLSFDTDFAAGVNVQHRTYSRQNHPSLAPVRRRSRHSSRPAAAPHLDDAILRAPTNGIKAQHKTTQRKTTRTVQDGSFYFNKQEMSVLSFRLTFMDFDRLQPDYPNLTEVNGNILK